MGSSSLNADVREGIALPIKDGYERAAAEWAQLSPPDAKIASAIKMWGWGRAGMILATALLFRHAVTFDQAVILIRLNVVLDRLIYGKQPSPRPQNRSSAAMRRRPKLLQPIKGRPVGAGARIGYCAAPPNLIPERTEITESWARETYRKRASTNK